MDSAACNYNPSANTDDGSCLYPEVGYDCDFNFLGCPEGTDAYTLNAYDSNNDGWGNTAMNVYFDGELQLFEMAIAIFGTDINSFPLPGIDHTYSLGLQFSQDCVPDPFNGMQYEQCSTHSPVICVDPSVECFTFETFTYDGVWYAQDPSEVSWEWVGPNGDILVSGDVHRLNWCESLSLCEQCAEAGGFYCGDDESNWTVYSEWMCSSKLYR